MAVNRIETGLDLASPLHIRQFTYQDKAELLRLYLSHRRFFTGKENIEGMSVDEAERFGTYEIQGLVLEMLGLKALTKEHSEIPKIKPIVQTDVNTLTDLYRADRKFYVDHDLSLRFWTNKLNKAIGPEDARTKGRMDQLKRVIVKMGQEKTIKIIDTEIGSSRGELIWEEQRKTLRGELF